MLLHNRGTQVFFLFTPQPPPPPRHTRPHARSRQRTHAPTAGNIAAHCISRTAWRKTQFFAILARWEHLVIALRYCQHPQKIRGKTEGDSRAFVKRVPSPCVITLRYCQLPPSKRLNIALTDSESLHSLIKPSQFHRALMAP
jgi:hypothetical protein